MSLSPRGKRRWLAVIGLAVVLVIGIAYSYARVEWEGSDLGDNIAAMLNKRMRGRISIGSVEWQPSALKAAVSGGWVPIVVRNVKVWDDCALSADLDPLDERRRGDPAEDCTPDDKPDPDPASKRKPRKLLIDAPLVTAEIDAHAAMFGNHDLVFRNVWVHGGKALLEQVREPYPLHAYDRTIVSIVTAFYPRQKAGFRAGLYAAEAPPKFDLRDIHIKDLDLTLQFAPYKNKNGTVGYGLAARVENVDVDATPIIGIPPTSYLHMNGVDPLVTKFYVRLAVRGHHTRVRILDEGKREAFVLPSGIGAEWTKGRKAQYEVELSEIVVNRLAQLPDQWGKGDYVANNLDVDLSAHTVPCKTSSSPTPALADGADLHLTGELLEYWDRPYDGKWDLQLAVKNFGPTLRSCIKSTMGGDNLNGTVRLSGPFIASPKVSLDLEGLDFDVPLSEKEEPVRLTLAEVHGDIDLVNEQGSIDRTNALIRGGKEPGEVMVGATFQLKPWRVRASVDIIKPIDIGRFLPQKAVAVGKFLSGKLTAEGDSELGFELKDFDLTLGRNEKEKSIRVYRGRLFTANDFELIEIQKVAIEAGRSHAVFDGWVNTVKDSDNVSLTIDGCFPDLGMWLERFGLPRWAESACGGSGGGGGVSMINWQAGPGGGGGSTVTIKGNYKNPTITVQTTLAGVPCMDKLGLNVTLANDIATIHQITSSGLGGSLTGTGELALPPNEPARIEKLHLEGKRLDAAKLCGLKGIVKGTIDSLEVDVKPTTIAPNRDAADWLASFKVLAQVKHISILGESYSNANVCINRNDDGRCRPGWADKRLAPTAKPSCEEAKKNGGFCAVSSADRDVGGHFAATIADVPPKGSGKSRVARRLGGTVALDDIPLAALDPIVGKGNVGGLISATLDLAGDRNAPSVAQGSTINLTRAWIAGAYVGDMQLGVLPTTYGNVHALRIYGYAMANQLGLDTIIGTAAPYPVDLAFSGRRVEIDQFVNLTKKLGLSEPVQAWASGTVTLRTELKPAAKPPAGKAPRSTTASGLVAGPEAWVELSEVEAIVDHRTRDGRRIPIKFHMQQRAKDAYALSMRVTPQTLELSCRSPSVIGGREPCPARLVTPAGVVEISGGATQTQMAISAIGQSLELRKLADLFESQIEEVSGKVELTAKVGGTFGKPTYEISLDVKDQLSLRLPGGESVLQVLGPRVVDGEKVPGAQIKIVNGVVGFGSFVINVKDERKDEQGELELTGSVALQGAKPAVWGLRIGGKIAGKMLSAIAPGQIAQASGLARIDANLVGKGELPQIDAQLTFDPEEGAKTRPQPLTILPRGLRREIALLGGVVDIKTAQNGTYSIDFSDEPLTATIDSVGTVSNITGSMTFVRGKLDHAEIALDAENIPYRKDPLDLIISAKNVDLRLPNADAAWKASGDIAIVNGSYRRNFELTEVIKPAPENVAPAKAFWEAYPSIGNADLDLTVEVRKFTVENNIAPNGIELAGPRLLISGSPRDPRISGAIRVQRGEFKLPATRVKFTRTFGSIDFAENQKASNPTLDITSEAPDYLDLSGQQHTITMTISGTLEQPLWDLKTSTGYNKSQTLALLFLGRNPEQLRRSLGDTSIGSNPVNIETSTNPSGSAGDQLIRDLAGDWVSGLLGSSLSRFTPFDVLRFEIGFGTIALHGEKKLYENIKFLGDAEQTVRGRSLNARAEVKAPWHFAPVIGDRLTLQFNWLDKNFNDPAELDIQDYGGRVVYRILIP